MASTSSFDISTGADLQEVDNAVNQAVKEIGQRYDFKGTQCGIEFDRDKAEIRLLADDDFRMEALLDVVRGKLVKRGVPVRNLVIGDPITGSAGSIRRTIGLTQGIAGDVAKKIVKAIKDKSFKKVQASIQGEEVRLSGKQIDDLRTIMSMLEKAGLNQPLQYVNMKS